MMWKILTAQIREWIYYLYAAEEQKDATGEQEKLVTYCTLISTSSR